MTTVNITTTKNTVTIDESNSSVVTVATQGPQGPAFAATGTSLNDSNKVDGSVVFFDESSGTFIADSTTTKLTLVNGGNF
tara:strand:+ start:1325 stop:1564 length:240 start_codon:yes stop_codon:yes gene_type:complete